MIVNIKIQGEGSRSWYFELSIYKHSFLGALNTLKIRPCQHLLGLASNSQNKNLLADGGNSYKGSFSFFLSLFWKSQGNHWTKWKLTPNLPSLDVNPHLLGLIGWSVCFVFHLRRKTLAWPQLSKYSLYQVNHPLFSSWWKKKIRRKSQEEWSLVFTTESVGADMSAGHLLCSV